MRMSTPKLNLSDIAVGSRARILGTIVNRYVTGDKNYGFPVIDDTTDGYFTLYTTMPITIDELEFCS